MKPPGRADRARPLAAIGAIAAAICASPAAQGASFYIKEQSVAGLGRAFAGESAIGENASTIYFNPAGLTELERAEIDIGGHLLLVQADFEDRGSVFGPMLNIPTGGGDGGDPYDPTLVPNIYGALPLLDKRLWIGLGVSAPFGLANEYDRDWFGRYDSIESKLVTINAAPTIAYKFNDAFSIGAGLDIQYADAELTNAVPTLGPGGSTSIGAAGDLISRIEGDDVSVGFNIGVLMKPQPSTRIGIHYRSAISHTLEGEVKAQTRSGAIASAFDGAADLDLPDIFALGVAHQATPKLALFAEVNWYGWSNFEEIRVVRRDTGAIVSDVDQNYEDTFSVSVGAQYELTDRWVVRGGYQYDETPTVDDFRSTRTPDGDRNWLSAGASYEFNDRFVLDVAYAHIFVGDAEVNVTHAPGSPGAGAGSNTKGASEGAVDILSLGLRRRF